jgi:hypothetical protein
MEDWQPADGFRVFEPTKSRHPAHTFRISTRDLARFGQLYLQQGKWNGRQIVAAEWVKESTRPHTDDGDGTGYGYMWWTYQAGSSFTAKYPALGKQSFFRALGTGEQGLWVIPGAGLVVVHRADTDHGRRVESVDHWALVESIVAARKSDPEPAPDLRALQPAVLASQLPPEAVPEYREANAKAIGSYLGDYEVGPGARELGGYTLARDEAVRVFLFEQQPFVHLPGVGDVQMFPADGADAFIVRILPGMRIAFQRAANQEVIGIALTLGDDMVRASRTR